MHGRKIHPKVHMEVQGNFQNDKTILKKKNKLEDSHFLVSKLTTKLNNVVLA